MTSETQLQDVLKRLNHLERQNRKLKSAWSAAALGIFAIVLMGQTAVRKIPDVLEAQRFILRDSNGRGRAVLGFAPDNSPVLILNRPDGSLGATLEVVGSQGQPMLSLYDRDGKPRAVLGVDSDGSPGISFSDKDGKARVGLAVSSEGSGGLVLYGDDAKPRASIGLTRHWSPLLILADESGNPRVLVGNAEVQAALTGTINKKSDFPLSLLDKAGKVIWSAP